MTIRLKSFFVKVFVFLFLSFAAAPSSRAENSIGDAAIMVGLTTVAGAVFGASTLPFYEDPGEYKKNILYGAAIGAVAGVLISAYSGVKEGPSYEEARLPRTPSSALSLNETPGLRLKAESSTAIRQARGSSMASPFLWSPVAALHF